MARNTQRRARDARGTELEATGIHIRGAVAARAVAIERADREVIARRADHSNVDEGPDRGTVTGQTPGDALVRAADRVEREVARGGVALRARCSGRNVIGGLAGSGHIGREGRRGGMAATAVASGWMLRVECARGARVAGRGAGEHSHVRRHLVAGLAGGNRRRHGAVPGDAEGRVRDARRAELEATWTHVARAVTARAVAVEAADWNVVAGRADHRDVDEGTDRRTMTGQTPGDALVRAGDGVERVVARGGVALRARRVGRNVVRGPRRGASERDRVMARAAITTLRVIGIERRRGTRVGRLGVHTRVH